MSEKSSKALTARVADSAFMRKVVGPKVIEPLSSWYRQEVVDAPDEAAVDSDEPAPSEENGPASPSLTSAKAAEAFLAGDAQDAPRPSAARPTEPTPTEAVPAPPVGGFAGFKDIAMRVKGRVKEHNLNIIAAGIAFWALLAIPAILTAVVSIYGLVSSPEDVENQINDLLSGASEEVQTIVGDQLRSIAGGSGSGLAIGAAVGLVLALWTTSGAVAKLIAALNTICGVAETRSFVRLRGTALLLTVGAIVFVGVAGFLLGALPAVVNEIGAGDGVQWLLNIGRFPAMLVFMAIALSVLYRIGPDRSSTFRVVTWGGGWATVLWLVLSSLFSIYTATLGSYNETYGSLGAIVVLLLWLFITALMVLIGAEIDAAREERTAGATNARAPDPNQRVRR